MSKVNLTLSQAYSVPSPCKDCESKGCGSYHDQCELFQNWKQSLDEANGKIRQNKEDDVLRSAYVTERKKPSKNRYKMRRRNEDV